MGLGRRKVAIDDARQWVFNRMAQVYDARPAYPSALIDALVALAGPPGSRVVDLGAGIGHLALPLSERGLDVQAIDPAEAMLARLREAAEARGVAVSAIHAAAEATPLAAKSCQMAVIADALHFLDAERCAREVARVLVPNGALALITCELADTPFMRSLVEVMQDSAPRRPRVLDAAIEQLSAVAGITFSHEQRFDDETAVDRDTLERILRSISFIGPAMNRERFARFCARVHELPFKPHWARTIHLRAGRRRAQP